MPDEALSQLQLSFQRFSTIPDTLFRHSTRHEMSQENKPAYQERYGDDLSKDDEIVGSNFHRDYFPGNISSAFASRIAHRATKRS